MRFSEIIQALGDEVTASSLTGENGAAASQISDPRSNPNIDGLAAIQEANSQDLSYVEGAKFAAYVATTSAGALVLPNDEALQSQASDRNIAWVSVKNPRLVFAKAINVFYQPYRRKPGIHPTAVV
ncbi:MAG: LpxD N-terminal domain-containing protein, partial [Cyanobacteria bacterium J06627_32]